MTAYHGGKQRIGKQLAEVIVDESIYIAEEENFKIKGYCEPFCGMLGVYRYIPQLFEEVGLTRLKYKAGDINESVIKMWKAAQKGWKPPTTVSEKEYNRLKKSKRTSPKKGYVGHQYSFAGQWYNGYAPRYGKNPSSIKASKNVQNISKILHAVQFEAASFKKFSRLKGFVIYCDPPYENTVSGLKGTYLDKTFNIVEFWDWCLEMAKNNIVFVSSYEAPKGIEEIYTSTHRLTGNSHTRKTNNKRTEKLFKL